jgi:hypothetical protein
VLWAAQAAHLGVKWVVGNGAKVRFWEDKWVGNTKLDHNVLALICN